MSCPPPDTLVACRSHRYRWQGGPIRVIGALKKKRLYNVFEICSSWSIQYKYVKNIENFFFVMTIFPQKLFSRIYFCKLYGKNFYLKKFLRMREMTLCRMT